MKTSKCIAIKRLSLLRRHYGSRFNYHASIKSDNTNKNHQSVKSSQRVDYFFKRVKNESVISDFALGMLNPELLKIPDLNVPKERLINILYKIEETNPHFDNPITVREMKSIGLYGAFIPVEYNGLGLSLSEFTYLLQYPRISRHALSLIAQQSMCAFTILNYGTKEQKQKYLPALASGESIGAFCLTETSSGSDMLAMKTTAVETYDGDAYMLTGEKNWVINGNIADVLIVFGRTLDSKHEKALKRITAFIVDRHKQGITVKSECQIDSLKEAHIADLSFDGVLLEQDQILFEANGGYKIANYTQNNARCVVSAVQAGLCRQLLSHYSQVDSQYQYIIDYCHTLLYSMESSVCFTTRFGDKFQELEIELESASIKMFCSESSQRIIEYLEQLPKNKNIDNICVNLQCLHCLFGSPYFLSLYVGGTILNLIQNRFYDIKNKLKNKKTSKLEFLKENFYEQNSDRIILSSFSVTQNRDISQLLTNKLMKHLIIVFNKIHSARHKLIDALRNLSKDATQYQFMMSYFGDIGTLVYVAATCIARANTTHGDYETECTLRILIELEDRLDFILDHIGRISQGPDTFIPFTLAEDVFVNNNYPAKDVLAFPVEG